MGILRFCKAQTACAILRHQSSESDHKTFNCCDHNAQTERTALHIAAANQQPEVIALLLAANAPHDAKDSAGNVPLHLAVQVPHQRPPLCKP